MVVASICVCLVFVSLALARRDAAIYPSNVRAGGVAIGNLTREQAVKALAGNSRAADKLKLKLPDKTLRIPLKDIGVQYDQAATLAIVNACVFKGDGLAGLLHHSIIRGKQQEIAPVFIWDAQVLKKKMLALKAANDKPALDARILYSNNYWEYVSHNNGYTIDTGRSLQKLSQALQRGNLANLSLAVSETYPRVKLDDVSQINGVIGRSEISLPGPLAQYAGTLRYINGMIVRPGDIIDLAAGAGKGYSVLIAEVLTSTCYQGGLKSKNGSIYNSLAYPVLLSSTTNDGLITIKIYSCKAATHQ